MKVSVLIPTYNSAKTIALTLESVFSQTEAPGEVLIMDDGSTDDTVTLLRHYGPRITLLQQRNGGVAHARNVLVKRAQGELLAFLDHDDIWHPEYIASQLKLYRKYPDAVGFFTGHHVFIGHGHYNWSQGAIETDQGIEVIPVLDFLRQYHRAIGKFASMSFCCIPQRVFVQLTEEPFSPEVNGVDDFYFFHTLMLLGSVVFNPKPLVVYRVTPGAQSASLLKSVQKAVRAMELLQARFQAQPDSQLRKAFKLAFAAQRRECGRVLMGTGQPEQARKQLALSLTHTPHPISLAKSLVWLFLTGVPARFQPSWPAELKALHAQTAPLPDHQQ